MIAPKTKRVLDSKVAEYRLQGLPLNLDDMVKIAAQEEARTGMPTADMLNPISLFNIGTHTMSVPPQPPVTHDMIQTQINSSLIPLVSKVDNISQQLDKKVDQIANLVHDMSKTNLALVHGVTEPLHDDPDDCEINVLTRSSDQQNPRQDTKSLSKPEAGTPNRQRNISRLQLDLIAKSQ